MEQSAWAVEGRGRGGLSRSPRRQPPNKAESEPGRVAGDQEGCISRRGCQAGAAAAPWRPPEARRTGMGRLWPVTPVPTTGARRWPGRRATPLGPLMAGSTVGAGGSPREPSRHFTIEAVCVTATAWVLNVFPSVFIIICPAQGCSKTGPQGVSASGPRSQEDGSVWITRGAPSPPHLTGVSRGQASTATNKAQPSAQVGGFVAFFFT